MDKELFKMALPFIDELRAEQQSKFNTILIPALDFNFTAKIQLNEGFLAYDKSFEEE